MDSDDVLAEFDRIVGQQPKIAPDLSNRTQPDEEQISAENTANFEKQSESPETPSQQPTTKDNVGTDAIDGSWIPEVKRLVQFQDRQRNTQVRPVEDFSHKRNPADTDINYRWRQYSFILRRVLDDNFQQQGEQLELRSDALKEIFRAIGRPYSDIDLDTDPVIIRHPFVCLFHLRDQIEDLQTNETTPSSTKKELAALLSFISKEPSLQRIIAPYDRLVSRNMITRDLHWALFRPHEWVYIKRLGGPWTTVTEEECVFATTVEERYVDSTDKDKSTHVLHYVRARHNGYGFGITKDWINFGSKSKEVVRIDATDLTVIPLRVLPSSDKQKLRSHLIERGKKYRELCEEPYNHGYYSGPASLPARQAGRIWQTSQRVVVDGRAEREFRDVEEHQRLVASCLEEYLKVSEDSRAHHNASYESPLLRSNTHGTSYGRGKSAVTSVWNKHGESDCNWTEEDYLMCPSTVTAFLLRDKIWANIQLLYLTPNFWDENAFDMLQIEPTSKKLVRTIASRYKDSLREPYDRITNVRDRGFVVLLEGEAGLGKTLTAEIVAEDIRRPFHSASWRQLSLGDLDKNLDNFLGLSRRWEAVSIVEDVEEIMKTDLPTFLRRIEKHEGIVFLKSTGILLNSRLRDCVHITISYRGLRKGQRANIWRQHLREASALSLNGYGELEWPVEAFDLLGMLEFNGREIRTCVRGANHFATALGSTLTLQHILVIIRNREQSGSGSRDDAVEIVLTSLEALAEKLSENTARNE